MKPAQVAFNAPRASHPPVAPATPFPPAEKCDRVTANGNPAPNVPVPSGRSVSGLILAVTFIKERLMSTVLNRMPPETYQSQDEQASKPQFPGIPTSSDGAGMVVWVETRITQGACAYPITSSTTMGGGYQVEVANGKRNLWGDELAFIEPESEHSAATTCEGFAVAGGRVTNFTSGQGLILMKEVLYTISGKRLPVVFHIGARALTSQSLNVHTGHDDVVGVADCGWGILYARNAQEAGDFALIARRTAEDTETPFLNVQDGFLTTHTIENVLLPEPDMMKQYVGALRAPAQPDGPADPADVGRGPESGQLHEGEDRPAPLLRSGYARAQAGHARVLPAHRPPLRCGDALSPGGRRICHRRLGLHDRNRRSRRGLHARPPWHQSRPAAHLQLPPLPIGGYRARLAPRQSHLRHRAAGYPDDAVQPEI